MVRITKNKFIDALLNVILVAGILHLTLLITICIIRRDITYLNFFRIIEIDAFFPYITQGPLSQITSLAIIAALYFLMLFFYTKKD